MQSWEIEVRDRQSRESVDLESQRAVLKRVEDQEASFHSRKELQRSGKGCDDVSRLEKLQGRETWALASAIH